MNWDKAEPKANYLRYRQGFNPRATSYPSAGQKKRDFRLRKIWTKRETHKKNVFAI